MNQPFLIRITDNQLLNLRHIIGAAYSPPIPGPSYVDEDGEEVHPRGAILRLCFAQIESEDNFDPFDGGYRASTSVSKVVKLTGTDADRVWKLLQGFELKPIEPASQLPNWDDMTPTQRRSYEVVE